MVTFSVNKDVYAAMPKVTKLNLNPTKKIEQEWLSEAYIKILEGKKDIGTVELSAYAEMCERVSALERAKKCEVALLDSTETILGYEGIHVDLITDNRAEEGFSVVEATADMNYYIENFTDMWEYVFLENGRDMWVLLKLSMEGNKKVQSKMRTLIQEFEHLDEIISFAIKNPCCFTALAEIFQYTVEMAS